MKVVITLQRKHRTLSILYDDQGKPIAYSNDPKLVMLDHLMDKAREFMKERKKEDEQAEAKNHDE